MSRGYKDERVILQVFLMFLNRADLQGNFGNLSHESPEIKEVRMSVSDLYVLLICTLYHHDKRLFEGYVLYDRYSQRGRTYKLKQRRDF